MESYYIYGYAVLLNARTLNTITIENSNQKPYRQGFDITRKVMYVAFHSDSAVYVCMRYVDIVVDVAVIRRHCFCRLAFFSLLFLIRPLSLCRSALCCSSERVVATLQTILQNRRTFSFISIYFFVVFALNSHIYINCMFFAMFV